MKISTPLLLAALLCSSVSSLASESPGRQAVGIQLAAVAAPELPAKCAELVQNEAVKNRPAMTVEVVRNALKLRPASAPQVVAAIAPLAAGVAASEQPSQAAAIAKAAASAAPARAAEIASAVARAIPAEFRKVAVAAAQGAPGADKEILRSLAETFPALRPGIEDTLASYGGRVPSMDLVLASVASPPTAGGTTSQTGTTTQTPSAPPSTTGSTGTGVRGPGVGGPYIPLSGTATNVSTGSSGDLPTGGRDYSAP
jgi:hypothetical protein